MTNQQAIQKIRACAWTNGTKGLHRIQELLARLDHPQHHLKFIHVAGSNGKGSTCAMLHAILKESGLRVGLFTSPHLVHFEERIQINGIPIENVGIYAQTVLDACETMQEHPTEFELILALALLYYQEQKTDIVVLEVGLGGRLDATNSIPPPEVAVITNIAREHTEFLGNTLTEIATEKGGIIKENTPTILYHQSLEVEQTITKLCPNHLTITQDYTHLSTTKEGQSFSYQGEDYTLALLGRHQCENALVAIETVKKLREKGWNIPQTALKQGLSVTKWQGRFEQMASTPDLILDGGHNPQCSATLARTLAELYPNQKIIFILGMMAEKEHHDTIAEIAPLAKTIFTVGVNSPRTLTAEALATLIRDHFHLTATPTQSSEQALAQAMTIATPTDVICIFGSLYLIGEIRSQLETKREIQ